MMKPKSSRAGPAKQTSKQTSLYNPHSTSMRRMFSFSPCLRWRQVAEHVGTCPRTDTSKLRRSPLLIHASEQGTRTATLSYPFILSALRMFISITNQSCFETVVTGTRQVHRKGDGAKYIPRNGTSQRESECGPGFEGACLSPLSAEFQNPRENWEIQRKNTFLFYFEFLHSGVDENQLVERPDKEPMTREHLSAFRNTPTNRMKMGGAPLKSLGLSPRSYCSTALGPASLQASSTTWLEDISSVGKERG